ncbi:MAG TPA: class A beta-lactamase-related serine hydrolase [Anaerolineae bacterium]|nr:class A beta-lactamase-related serine hydrolase [Anaerolineae bacterium]
MRSLTDPSLAPPTWRAIDAIMKQGLASVFPAGVLLIQQHGQTRFHQSYGWIEPEEKRWPVRLDTLFDLASLTKLFTATALLTLVNAGKIGLDTPVSQVIPEFRGVHPLRSGIDPHTKRVLPPDPRWKGKATRLEHITFRHLLTHTSGLAAWDDMCISVNQTGVIYPHQVDAATRQRRLNVLLYTPRVVTPPGTQCLYSDLGFILLGEALERLTAEPLQKYLLRHVLTPLGMTHVTFNPLAHGVPRETIAPTERCPWRQRRLWGEVHDENAACLGGVAGHAGLFGTASDVAKLGECYRTGGGGLLSPALAQEAISEQVATSGVRRGLGWQLMTNDGSPVGRGFGPDSFGHTGFTGVSLWVDPARALTVVLLTNRVYHGRAPEPIAQFRLRLHQAILQAVDTQLEPVP